MSGYFTNFVSRVLKVFKKEERRSRRDSPVPAARLRRSNSVIEDKRMKEAFASRTSEYDVWNWKISAVPSKRKTRFPTNVTAQGSDEEDSEVFLTPETERRAVPKRECICCKGDMNDLQHVLAFCQEDIPVRGRHPDRNDTRHGLRRSHSFDSKEAFMRDHCNRNTDWHEKFNSLRAHDDAANTSSFLLESEKDKTRPRKSVYSMVDSSGNQRMQELKNGKSNIPVPKRYTRHQIQDDEPKIAFSRNSCTEGIGHLFHSATHRQRARNVAHRSRVNATFDSLFGHYCNKKYRGNIIDCPSHCRWMVEAGVHMDEDGKGFKKCAKGKITLNDTEYKCAIKKMCDDEGKDYWKVIEKMARCDDYESTSTKSGFAVSGTSSKRNHLSF